MARNNIDESGVFDRRSYISDADTLSVMERAFASSAFRRALENVLDDYFRELQKNQRRRDNDDRSARRQQREESQSSYRGRRGRFVGAAAEDDRPSQRARRRRATDDLEDPPLKEDQRSKKLSSDEFRSMQEEYKELQDQIKELETVYKGEGYILFAKMRKEFDRIKLLEGSFAKGLLRQALVHTPLIGKIFKFGYEFRDSRRQARRNRQRLSADIDSRKKRLSIISDAMMDHRRALQQESEQEAILEGEQLDISKKNNELLRKILRTADSSKGGELDPSSISQIAGSVAASGGIARLLRFLISPHFLAVIGAAAAAIIGGKYLKDWIDKKTEDEQITKVRSRAENTRRLERSLSGPDLAKAAELRAIRDSSDGKFFGNQYKDLEKKFREQRGIELRKSGMSAADVKQQLDKEWNEYNYLARPKANSPVARILHDELIESSNTKGRFAQGRVTSIVPIVGDGSGVRSTESAGGDSGPYFSRDTEGLDNIEPNHPGLVELKLLGSEYRDHNRTPLPTRSVRKSGGGLEVEMDPHVIDGLESSGSLERHGFRRTGPNVIEHQPSNAAPSADPAIPDSQPSSGSLERHGFRRTGPNVIEHQPSNAAPSSAAPAIPDSQPSISRPAPVAHASVGSSSPVQMPDFERVPYESPSAKAARATAITQQQQQPVPQTASPSISASSIGGMGLNSIPMLVDNLPLLLYNSGGVD